MRHFDHTYCSCKFRFRRLQPRQMARESLSLSFLPFPARLLLLLAWLLAGGLATWLARRRPAGWARAVAALPLVALNQLAAAGFFDGDAELISNCAHFITACITNMKVRGMGRVGFPGSTGKARAPPAG